MGWSVPGLGGGAGCAGVGGAWRPRAPTHLEEADEVAQHQAVDAGQRVHHGYGSLWALVLSDALLVELVRDQGLLQLPVPQLQQRRCRHSERLSQAQGLAPLGREQYGPPNRLGNKSVKGALRGRGQAAGSLRADFHPAEVGCDEPGLWRLRT